VRPYARCELERLSPDDGRKPVACGEQAGGKTAHHVNGARCQAEFCKSLIFMERETGIEPATFSLGNWLQIENKEHSEFGHLFQAIEFRQNSQFSAAWRLMEFKWSSLITELDIDSNPDRSDGALRSGSACRSMKLSTLQKDSNHQSNVFSTTCRSVDDTLDHEKQL